MSCRGILSLVEARISEGTGSRLPACPSNGGRRKTWRLFGPTRRALGRALRLGVRLSLRCRIGHLSWVREIQSSGLRHYNDVSGIDRYRNASSILQIGRIQPSPESVEAIAGALTGTEPANRIPPPAPGMPRNWFKSVPRAIRMKDGTGGVLVERCDLHPDPLCEAACFSARER